MSVTFARGFRAAGVTAGMKPSGRPDLGLLVADESHSAAGLFTTNAFAAAPVRLSRHRVSRGGGRAVLVNSGQANAGTGLSGDNDAEHSTAAVAELLAIEPDEVLACSTKQAPTLSPSRHGSSRTVPPPAVHESARASRTGSDVSSA